jgi:hypothetical protein
MHSGTTRFDWNTLSRRILGALIAFHPKISSLAWEQAPVFILAAFIIEIGGPLDFEQLYNISPSLQTAENLVFDFAADSAMFSAILLTTRRYIMPVMTKHIHRKAKMGDVLSYYQ